MKRLTIFVSVIFIMTLLINIAFAQTMPSKNIHQAAYEGDIKEINLNLQNGTDINDKNRMGYTALHAAIIQKQKEAVNLLIEKGADVNAVGGGGQTPLQLAVKNGDKELVQTLISKGANVNAVDTRGDNALTISRQNQFTEITELLIQNGATEPVIDDMERYRSTPQAGEQNQTNRQNAQPGNAYPGRITQQAEEDFVLGDPNEIKKRIKTFKDLEKNLTGLTAQNERVIRQWRQTRTDNRNILINSVEKQYVDELEFVKKIATEEKAKKTIEQLDNLLKVRKERYEKIKKEILTQRREQRQEGASQGRGRGRTSGRTSRRQTRTNQYGNSSTNDAVYGRGTTTTRNERSGQTEESLEQLDPATQEEMDLWLDSTVDNKENLLAEVHNQLFNEIGSIRKTAEEEKAQKTVVALDGILLNRQVKFNEVTAQMAEDRARAQEREERNQSSGTNARGRRGRTAGRGGTNQWNSMNQQNQSRSRGRRR